MLVGPDGCGKTTLAGWLFNRFRERGYKSRLVWSRFNNYFSKPLLALARLTGHNYYRTYNGVRFGFHDFETLRGFRALFAFLQAIDVNISTYFRLTRLRKRCDILVCERGPWDTLVDVIADTGLDIKRGGLLKRLITCQVTPEAAVYLIERSMKNILSTRPELVHDYKLDRKIAIYKSLAESMNWPVIDNNSSLEEAKSHLSNLVGLDDVKR